MSEFSDTTLVLLGHGSTVNAESALPTYQHADELRRRGLFAQVIEGFWKQEPNVCAVLRGAFTPRVFIVPVFISEGYFTEEVLPRELGFCAPGQKISQRVRRQGNQTLYYCGPVGTHDSMTSVLLARAQQVVAQNPVTPLPTPKEIALFIAGHGTGSNENSRKTIERQVDLIREKNLYAEVHPAFMEEAPYIKDCYQATSARNLVMVPFFISDGLHSHEDIPQMLGESAADVQARYRAGQPTWPNPTERHGRRLWYSPSIGSEPLIADVILQRVREAAQPSSSQS